MKLSEVRGERVFDVIADIIDPISRIAQNDATKELFEKKKLPEGVTARQAAAARLVKCAPVLLRECKSDMITIMASIKGVSYEEFINGMSFATLLFELNDLLNDEALIELFTSAQSENSSGSVPVNIAAGL